MLDWMLDPPEPTAEEIFIDEYCYEFCEDDDKVAIVRELYPDVKDEKKFWQLVDDYAYREAQKVWNEKENDRLEAWADSVLCERYGY